MPNAPASQRTTPSKVALTTSTRAGVIYEQVPEREARKPKAPSKEVQDKQQAEYSTDDFQDDLDRVTRRQEPS